MKMAELLALKVYPFTLKSEASCAHSTLKEIHNVISHLFDILIFKLRLSRLAKPIEQQLGGPVSDGATQLVVICYRDKN